MAAAAARPSRRSGGRGRKKKLLALQRVWKVCSRRSRHRLQGREDAPAVHPRGGRPARRSMSGTARCTRKMQNAIKRARIAGCCRSPRIDAFSVHQREMSLQQSEPALHQPSPGRKLAQLAGSRCCGAISHAMMCSSRSAVPLADRTAAAHGVADGALAMAIARSTWPRPQTPAAMNAAWSGWPAWRCRRSPRWRLPLIRAERIRHVLVLCSSQYGRRAVTIVSRALCVFNIRAQSRRCPPEWAGHDVLPPRRAGGEPG